MEKRRIYMDYAATTPVKSEVLEAMMPYYTTYFGNASSFHQFGREAKEGLDKGRAQVASLINADPREVYFTNGGSESDNWALEGTAFARRNKGNHIITSKIEHHAVLHTCEYLEKVHGFEVTYLDVDADGKVDLEQLKNVITDKTILVSVMFANNEIGTIQPIRELCKVAHTHGALFHTDAVQAVGHVKIDVHELGVDFLSASAHKFNGPKGVGFLYIRKGVELPPYADGGAQENAHRAGTENIASIIGMAAALKANCDALEQNLQYISKLEHLLISMLDESEIAYRRNGGENRLPGLVSLSFPGKDGETILHRMDLMGISISTGSACDSVNTEISHVLQAIMLDEEHSKGTVRISLGKNNTEAEAGRIAEALIRIIV